VDTGLFTDVALVYGTLNHVGPIRMVARTTPAKLGPACAALLQELDLLGEADYFTQADLEAANKRVRVAAALDWQSSSALAHSIAYYWSAAGFDYFLEYFDALSEQTAEDVHRYVAEYITGRPKVMSVLMSQRDRRAKRSTLRACVAKWRAP
jgi:predicted Zn-dependent peptidase